MLSYISDNNNKYDLRSYFDFLYCLQNKRKDSEDRIVSKMKTIRYNMIEIKSENRIAMENFENEKNAFVKSKFNLIINKLLYIKISIICD